MNEFKFQIRRSYFDSLQRRLMAFYLYLKYLKSGNDTYYEQAKNSFRIVDIFLKTEKEIKFTDLDEGL